MQKKELRSYYLQQRKQLSTQEIYNSSKKICENFLSFASSNLIDWQQKKIALYQQTKYEVATIILQNYLQQKKITYYLPKIKDLELEFYEFTQETKLIANKKFSQILEPNSKNKCLPDIVIVPLVAVDKSLNRLGMGKGYYDKTLVKISAIAIGFAFNFQVCNQHFIKEEHDYQLDYVITETKILQSDRSRSTK